MSLSNNFPTIKPSLNLDFANTGTLDPRVTFARASTATYYDGVTTAKAEENLLTYSQEFDNAAWSKNNTTVTANTTTAPDGTTTADTITDNATSASHSAFLGVASIITAGTTYTLSCYLKAGTSNYGYLSLQDAATPQRYFAADFDLSGGTVRTSAAGTSGTLTSATITSVGSGWYRCVIIGQVAAVGTTRFVVGVSDGTTAISSYGTIGYVGSGSTIYAWGAQLEQRSSVTAYTATTDQPITNYIPVLQTAAANVARFDHNPTTGEALGLLIEEQRTNLVTYSADFSNAAWSSVNVSVGSDVNISPAGSQTADSLTRNSSVAACYMQLGPALTITNQAYTFTAYVKAKSAGGYFAVQHQPDFANRCMCTFDLTTGVAATPYAPGGSTATAMSASMASVGNGWYRIAFTATLSAASGYRVYFGPTAVPTSGDSWVNASATLSDCFIWGAQLEAGAFPTSYIATTSAQVTRSADAASMTGTNFSSWYNQGEGAVYVEQFYNSLLPAASFTNILSISDNSTNNRLILYSSNATQVDAVVQTNGSTQAQFYKPNVLSAGNSVKLALSYEANNFAFTANGAAVDTDNSGVVPSVDRVFFEAGAIGTAQGNRYLRKVSYYPQALTAANLQALTS